MKKFTLFEALTDAQKVQVDAMGDGSAARTITGHFMGDRMVVPIQAAEAVKPHPEVESFLKKHNYDITDYGAGHATGGPYGRSERIGRLLDRLSAPDSLKTTFAMDPKRATKTTQSTHQVVISRHPHDVAAQSTGQGWESCMTMGTGMNRHYLERDVAHGTHVAYLTKAGDDQADNAIARISLKPHRGETADGTHTVLRPETSTYGEGSPAFEKTVGAWAQKHTPMKPRVVYHKEPSLYNDGSPTTIANWSTWRKEDLQNVSSYSNRLQLARHGVPEVREHLWDQSFHDVPSTWDTYARHGNTVHIAHMAANLKDAPERAVAAIVPHMDEAAVVALAHKHKDDYASGVHEGIMKSPHTAAHDIVIDHPGNDPHYHMTRLRVAATHGPEQARLRAIAKDPEVATYAVEGASEQFHHTLMKHPDINKDPNIRKRVGTQLVYHGSDAIKKAMLARADDYQGVFGEMAHHAPHLLPDMLGHTGGHVRAAAVPAASPAQRERLLKDSDPDVRQAMAAHGNSEQQMHIAKTYDPIRDRADTHYNLATSNHPAVQQHMFARDDHADRLLADHGSPDIHKQLITRHANRDGMSTSVVRAALRHGIESTEHHAVATLPADHTALQTLAKTTPHGSTLLQMWQRPALAGHAAKRAALWGAGFPAVVEEMARGPYTKAYTTAHNLLATSDNSAAHKHLMNHPDPIVRRTVATHALGSTIRHHWPHTESDPEVARLLYDHSDTRDWMRESPHKAVREMTAQLDAINGF